MTDRELLASMAATILAERKQGAEEAVKDALRILDVVEFKVPLDETASVEWWKLRGPTPDTLVLETLSA